MNHLLPIVLRRLPPGVWSTDKVGVDDAGFAAAHGWDVIELDLSGAGEKATVLDRLGRAGSFPDHYGHNWDAAYDCLTDRQPGVDRILVLVLGAAGLEPEVARSLLAMLTDTADYWADRELAAYVVWEGLADHPTL